MLEEKLLYNENLAKCEFDLSTKACISLDYHGINIKI